MSTQASEAQPAMPPPPAPPRWLWVLALPLAIPLGLVGTYLFSFHGLELLQRLGHVSAEMAETMITVVMWGCFGGVPLALLGAGIAGLVSWPLGKYAARRWGWIGVLLAGILAGAIGGLLIAAGLLFVALL